MFQRAVVNKLESLKESRQVLALTGPRGVGKTTLALSLFKGCKYVELENPTTRALVSKDPRDYLLRLPQTGVTVLDEVHLVPNLTKVLSSFILENKDYKGSFCLISSVKSSLDVCAEKISSENYHIENIWPLSLRELRESASTDVDSLLYQGFYPALHRDFLFPADFNRENLSRYFNRDLAIQTNVQDKNLFHRFLEYCAHHSGELVNFSKLGMLCGISYNTAKHWLNLLVDAHIIYLLNPYSEGFGKRVVKSQKLYFVDTGLLSYILGIQSLEDLKSHSQRGKIFENFVVIEGIKIQSLEGLEKNCFFWRDKLGRDIELLIEKGNKLHPIDVLSKEYIEDLDFNDISKWKRWAYGRAAPAKMAYMGMVEVKQSQAQVIPWVSLGDVFSTI